MKQACAVDERHNSHGVSIHSIHYPVASHDEFPICATFIFWNVPARFWEPLELFNALLDVQSKGSSVAGGIRFDEGHQRLEVVTRNI